MTVRFAPAAVVRTPRPGGGFVLRSPVALAQPARCIGDWLVQHAAAAPERTFLAERAGTGWRRITYAEALASVRRLAQALLDAGLGPTLPLAILSGNSIDHALLALAAMHVGVPVAPISAAYSLASHDHGKLRALVADLAPGAVWAEGPAFAPALAALGVTALELPTAAFTPPAAAVTPPAAASTPPAAAVTPPAAASTPPAAAVEARAAEPGSAVDRAFASVTPDTVAKILFTSGSTGSPKGVVNTHRMLCANQAAIAAGWPFLADRPPVIVDWLPWSHTFGANHNFNMILAHGGTLYIDAGKPAPGAFDITLANLREVPSTLYFNVPRGFDMLVGALESDAVLRETFFRDLDLVFYAAAALSPATWDRLATVARRAGASPAMVSAWGSTETSPLVTQVHFPIDRAGVIGLPAPGVELAFAPAGDKLEMRVRGPSVAPGYWHAGGAIEPTPRDALGFYPMGDAGRLAEESAPERGVVFGGRTAENFKLASGTWVHVGELRIALIAACSPLVADAVITGHDRDEIGALIFAAPGQTVDDAFHGELATRIARCNVTRTGSSGRIARIRVEREPPSIDAGEITDKGYLNQRAILARRADAVAALYDGGAAIVIL